MVSLSRAAKLALILLLAQLTACASQPNERDPWEGMNRKIFAFNDTADKYVSKPIAQTYRRVTPDPVETGVDNMLNNLGELLNILSDLSQFKFKAVGTDSARFLINTTIGVGGFFEVASYVGLEKRTEDFGQVLGYWGMGSGPYLVLPILGPSTVRDAGASIIDAQATPINYVSDLHARYELRLLDLVNTRANLLKAEELISGDRYTFMRDAYLQRREYLINDGAVIEDSFGEEEFEDW